jgi:hypothetical protein
MDIKTELMSCREYFIKEEKYLSRCLTNLEEVEMNLQCFSMKEMIKNHLIYLKSTINNLSDECIDKLVPVKPVKLVKPDSPVKTVKPIKKIWPHNKVEIRRGMNLQLPDEDDFPNIKNFKEICDIKFYYRDPSVFKEGYGLFEFRRGDETYYVADNKKLYIYDTVENVLKVGVYNDALQYWK